MKTLLYDHNNLATLDAIFTKENKTAKMCTFRGNLYTTYDCLSSLSLDT